MRSLWLALALVVAPAAARADRCVYPDHQTDLVDGFAGVCPAIQTTPAGCAVFVSAVSPAAIGSGTVYALRGSAGWIQLADTGSLVATAAVDVSSIDIYSCDCAQQTASTPFDRLSLAIAGAEPGDVIARAPDADAIATIGSGSGSCASPDWATGVVENPACDLCSVDAGVGGAAGADAGTATGRGHAGCAAAEASSGALALAVMLVAARSRRRRR
jgi:uncharacterized protein (TIGR03382 family)